MTLYKTGNNTQFSMLQILSGFLPIASKYMEWNSSLKKQNQRDTHLLKICGGASQDIRKDLPSSLTDKPRLKNVKLETWKQRFQSISNNENWEL